MKKKDQSEIIDKIQEACAELGWNISIPDEEYTDGMIIGKYDYVVNVLSQLEDGENYEIWELPSLNKEELH